MDMYFRGRASLNKGMSLESLSDAERFFAQALALDPNNADALASAALVDLSIGVGNVSDDRAARLAAAEAAATKAVSLAPGSAVAHMALGATYILSRRAAQGIAECEQALALDRNLTDAHAAIALGKIFLGRPEETEGHIREALRLSPHDVFAFRWMAYVGIAKLLLGADAEAVTWLGHSIEANRNYPMAHFYLAAALALLGSMKDAQAAVQAGLALSPNFTLRSLRAGLAFSSTVTPNRERVLEAMRVAGAPEGWP
jgi:tetratricopeptide (TPR) repeat protein